MDDVLVRAAAALQRGDPLSALRATTGRSEPIALALRGVALAQIDETDAAAALLGQALRALPAGLDRARAMAALAEVELARRDFDAAARAFGQAAAALEAVGDRANREWVEVLDARMKTLLGAAVEPVPQVGASPLVRAFAGCVRAERAMVGRRAVEAHKALAEARAQAVLSGHPYAIGEVERLERAMRVPAATLWEDGVRRDVTLEDVEVLHRAGAGTWVDGFLCTVTARRAVVVLRHRPVLMSLLVAIARAGRRGADALVVDAFDVKKVNESHRARLRVELGRLRRVLPKALTIDHASEGWALSGPRPLRVLLPLDGAEAALAWLGDGQRWSAAALARASGRRLRTVQRELQELSRRGVVGVVGRARAQRYFATTRIASPMLLLGLYGAR